MSWVTILWVTIPSIALTLAFVHGLVWWRSRKGWDHALFAIAAVALAFFAAGEYWIMRSTSVAEFGTAARWIHVPGFLLVVTLTLFLRVNLRAGRPWLMWLVLGTRTATLIANFLTTPNLNYREIRGLQSVPFLGEQVTVADGVANPWMLLGQANLLLFVLFALDVSLTVWRRGDRRAALLLGGAVALFATGALTQIILLLWFSFDIPYTVSLFFSGILGVMAYELTNDVFRASRLAEDLSESEERLGLVLEAAGAGVWSWDFERGRIWATAKARALYGLPLDEEVTFDRFLATIHLEDRERIRRSALEAFHQGTYFNAEYRVVFPDESTHWVKVHSRVLRTSAGTPDRMMGVSIDTSRHKQSEGESSRLRLELAHLSRIMVMNQLSASLAHEINQPLGAILNNATAGTLMLKKPQYDTVEIGAILSDIAQDARRAGDVIRKIRGIVKKGEVQLELLQLNPVIEDVVTLFHGSIVMGKISIVLELSPGLPMVRADRVQLQQVLVNLITNAIDAMRRESTRILTMKSAPGSDDTIIVSISDSGTGLDSTATSRLFEAFYTTKRDGLGMGLGICRSILKDHGGRIWAENNPEKGATFTFSLPTARETSP